MNKQEMLETASELEKKSGSYYLKYIGWLFLGGMIISKAVESYALSSNHKMVAFALKEGAKTIENE